MGLSSTQTSNDILAAEGKSGTGSILTLYSRTADCFPLESVATAKKLSAPFAFARACMLSHRWRRSVASPCPCCWQLIAYVTNMLSTSDAWRQISHRTSVLGGPEFRRCISVLKEIGHYRGVIHRCNPYGLLRHDIWGADEDEVESESVRLYLTVRLRSNGFCWSCEIQLPQHRLIRRDVCNRVQLQTTATYRGHLHRGSSRKTRRHGQLITGYSLRLQPHQCTTDLRGIDVGYHEANVDLSW